MFTNFGSGALAMAGEFERLSAELSGRMRELGVGPTDPRLAPLMVQLQALMRERIAEAVKGGGAMLQVSAPAQECSFDLPVELAGLVRGYLAVCPPRAFAQAPALAESEAGRRILGLGLPDRVRIAAAAYAAWSAAPWGGLHGAGLRRVVSDLLRSKLTLADADAIALARAATREGFTHAGYSPNQAVFSALERHVAVHGLSPDLRGALEHLLEEMTRRGAEHNAQGRKLLTGVERLLSRQPGAANAIALFKPKPD